jgi:hypothetical protein
LFQEYHGLDLENGREGRIEELGAKQRGGQGGEEETLDLIYGIGGTIAVAAAAVTMSTLPLPAHLSLSSAASAPH